MKPGGTGSMFGVHCKGPNKNTQHVPPTSKFGVQVPYRSQPQSNYGSPFWGLKDPLKGNQSFWGSPEKADTYPHFSRLTPESGEITPGLNQPIVISNLACSKSHGGPITIRNPRNPRCGG